MASPPPDRPLRLAVLGSTGSIGRQALRVAERFPERVRVVALAAGTSGAALAEQASASQVERVALTDAEAAEEASRILGRPVAHGPEAVESLAGGDEADVVLNALVGSAGLRVTLRALRSGKRLALANKESLVAGGELVTSAPAGQLVPVDSEHSALFQCLLGEMPEDVSRLWLTASGGPFRGMGRAELERVSADQALRHPRWTMGPKITVDSATLMNKGLEAIEAHHLFGLPYDRVRIVVHPQSMVHSMVEFADASVKAHLGPTDMRIPIQYALSHPGRWEAPVAPVRFEAAGTLGFEEPDAETFRCLALALEAGRAGGTMPAVMNAANEVAVAAFLAGACPITDIDRTVERVMGEHSPEPLRSIEQVEAADGWARRAAREALGLP
ncbi:MAG: 1-deoxy-D-xylulose-5-phosphate reductoisomerase [Coriobacteriia bacterium]|nr:1-deoxy-D-xylulose-5-phosphate reductoisomerase [Coriobacteriia bacterium]